MRTLFWNKQTNGGCKGKRYGTDKNSKINSWWCRPLLDIMWMTYRDFSDVDSLTSEVFKKKQKKKTDYFWVFGHLKKSLLRIFTHTDTQMKYNCYTNKVIKTQL